MTPLAQAIPLERTARVADNVGMRREPKTRVCTKCGRRRPISQFLLRWESPARMSHCTECRGESLREWRRANQGEVNARQRVYQQRPDVKAKRRARDRARAAMLRKERAA